MAAEAVVVSLLASVEVVAACPFAEDCMFNFILLIKFG